MRKARLTTVSALLLAFTTLATASVDTPPPDDEAAVREGAAIVVGSFDGTSRTELRVYRDQFDDDGRRTTYTEVITRRGFTVHEVLDGLPLHGTVSINSVGGTLDGVTTPTTFEPGRPGDRVVLSLRPDRHADGYVAVHAKRFDAASDAQLGDLRRWVEEVRAPVPLAPDEIAERLHAAGGLPPSEAVPPVRAGVDPPGVDPPDIPDGWTAPPAEGSAPARPWRRAQPRPSQPRASTGTGPATAPTGPATAPTGRLALWLVLAGIGVAAAAVVAWRRRGAPKMTKRPGRR